MKKMILTAVLMMTATAALAGARHHKATNAEVERAIDSRLHELLVKLNAEKK